MNAATEQANRPVSPLKAPRKRKRIVISCTECHRRKQKCDRASPCSNCVTRNKEDLCHYENESARKAQLLEESGEGASADGASYRAVKSADLSSEAHAQVSAFGYTNSNGNNNTTLGIFKKIEGHDPDALLASPTSGSIGVSGLKEKYKSCIRQLPSKQLVETLLVTYFEESNTQYYPLDESIFRDQLHRWYSLPFATLNKGPLELPLDMQFFPALLFQMLASALQFQPPGHDPSLEVLKYAPGMTFDDLASDYSESGMQILNLLGKRRTNLLTVQTGYLRTQYLKTCGMVPESWHSLSQTIRDAQEIGLHKDHVDQPVQKPGEKAQDVLEMLWTQQLRRRIWLILSMWSVHMSIVLGRPTTVDARDGQPPFPIDAPIPKNFREEAPMPRKEGDEPTPLSKLLWIAELSAPLWDIYNLEREDPHQNNFARVEKMHKLVDQISRHCPAYFRAENPDTSFDHLPQCRWLPAARCYFQTIGAFTVMALHRPYIFTNSSSRTAALKAALDILRSQRQWFNLLSEVHHKLFTLVLNTFDSIVLVAAIYILHPYENPDDLDDCLQHFQWGIERFQVMSARNTMAKSALGVLKAVYVRLKKALAQPSKDPSRPSTNFASVSPPAVSQSPQSFSPYTTILPPSHHSSISSATTTNLYPENPSNTSNNSSSPYNNLPSIASMTSTNVNPSVPTGWENYDPNNLPITNQNYDLRSIAPLQPMHDLVYNDLGGSTANIDFDMLNVFEIPQVNSAQWQFEGDFGNDSFWGFMNNYTV